jgi:Arc/MetJ-type ribon-helix-helix transcriptional regulator
MIMTKSKRILFTFDPRSQHNLRKFTDLGGFPSASDAVRDALRFARAIQEQESLGFTEVVVRNPQTNQEKMVVSPWSGSQQISTDDKNEEGNPQRNIKQSEEIHD